MSFWVRGGGGRERGEINLVGEIGITCDLKRVMTRDFHDVAAHPFYKFLFSICVCVSKKDIFYCLRFLTFFFV